jgi:hypothetical protein
MHATMQYHLGIGTRAYQVFVFETTLYIVELNLLVTKVDELATTPRTKVELNSRGDRFAKVDAKVLWILKG